MRRRPPKLPPRPACDSFKELKYLNLYQAGHSPRPYR
jgi:hypothetical protein